MHNINDINKTKDNNFPNKEDLLKAQDILIDNEIKLIKEYMLKYPFATEWVFHFSHSNATYLKLQKLLTLLQEEGYEADMSDDHHGSSYQLLVYSPLRNKEAQEQYDKYAYIYAGICGGIVALCMLGVYFLS